MPQEIHVIDAVGSGDHPGHQRRHLQGGVDPAGGLQGQLAGDQVAQPASPSQRHRRRQTGTRDQVRVIEDRRNAMRYSHLPDALSD